MIVYNEEAILEGIAKNKEQTMLPLDSQQEAIIREYSQYFFSSKK